MSVELNENSMGDLLKEFDVKRINSGDILKGQIIDVNEKEATVNINYAFDGIITRDELVVGDVSPLEVVKPGDILDVYVISPNDGEGYVQLSRLRALQITEKEDLNNAFKNEEVIKVLVKEEVKGGLVAYYGSMRVFIPASLALQITEKEDLNNAFKNEEVIKVLVKEEVKGGLVAYYGSMRVFIPASLASRERIELNTLLGKEIEVKLIELDLRNRKIVASRRVLEEENYQAEKKELWKAVKGGEKREGIVKKIIKVGAIVDIGGITGLIHINDLAWERVKKVEDVVNVGDKVTVFIGDVDAENERVSLILKDVDKEPWKVHADSIKTGDVLEGKVVKFMSFGAFVELFPGIEGLVHINEITDENIVKPSDVLEVGQMVISSYK